MKDNGRTIEILFEEAVGAGWNEAGDDIRYAYSNDPEEIQEYYIENIFEQTLEKDEASKIVDGWRAMGKALEVTLLSKYHPIESTKLREKATPRVILGVAFLSVSCTQLHIKNNTL